MTNRIYYVIFTIVGLVLGSVLGALFFSPEAAPEQAGNSGEEKPLYWVAPMDASFRRDGPGKSPMGMDLVPVYASDQTDNGTVRINPAVEQNMGVKTAVAMRGHLSNTVRTVAFVEVPDEQVTYVYPRVEGWIQKSHVSSLGQAITLGQPLYTIYSPDLVGAQEELVSAVKTGNRNLVESSRLRLLALDVPEAFINRLEQSRQVQQHVEFRAQHNGVVTNLSLREGLYVNPGKQLLEISDLDPIWVTADLFGNRTDGIDVGDQMHVMFTNQQTVLRASVDFVYPTLEALKRTLRVRATVDNADMTLRPNMFAEAILEGDSGDSHILVPFESVIRVANQDRVVLAMREGEYKSVAVTVGQSDGEQVEVIDGLNEGDRVVTSAQFLIDSESSKTSDFSRMGLATADHTGMDHSKMDHSKMDHEEMTGQNSSEGRSVRTSGQFLMIDGASRTVSLKHDPIPEWNWPTMTMMMNVSDDVDLSKINKDATYQLRLTETPDAETGYRVSDVKPVHNH